MERQETESEKFITAAMIEFINQHSQSAHLSTLDEIVLNYVATVLESLATEPAGSLEECFDVEEFCEMLSAYFPDFATIPHAVVSQWTFDLVSTLQKQSRKPSKEPVAFETLLCEIEQEREPRSKRNSESSSDSSSYSGSSKKSSTTRTPRVSETSESESDVVDIIQRLQLCQIQYEDKMRTLMEMFPTLLRVDAQHYISITNGDLEKAVQMVLVQLENGGVVHSHISPQTNLPLRPRVGGARSVEKVDEKALKDRVVARYGFIDQAEDAKEFRPAPPKAEPKKLVRYRESQVVSTKGERYSEVRCTKDGEETRSKNYINKAHRHN